MTTIRAFWGLFALFCLSFCSAQLVPGDILISCGNTEVDSGVLACRPDGSGLGLLVVSPSQLQRPSGLSVDMNGRIVVASTGTYQVHRANPATGVIESTLGPLEDGSLRGPTDLVFNGYGFFLSDFDGGAVRELTPMLGTYVEPGEVGTSAAHMALHDRRLYVSDTPNGVVWSVDLSTRESRIEVAGGGLISPTGLAFDPEGRLLIADSYQNRLYRRDGSTLTLLTATPLLDHPSALLVLSSGRLLVANEGGGTVLEFTTAGAFVGVIATGLPSPTHLAEYRVPNGGVGIGILEGCQTERITLELRDIVSGALVEVIGPIPTDHFGNFEFGTFQSGTFDIYARAPQFLRRYVGRFHTSLLALTFHMINGDCNGDNEIEIGDFALLAASFGLTEGQIGYDARADLNCDFEIDIGDFAILSSNFGQSGD